MVKVDLGCTIDLKKVASTARNVTYNPARFSALYLKLREPKTTASLFKSGKMNCLGAKTEEDAQIAARKFAKMIQKSLGFEVRFKKNSIVNIVATCSLNFELPLRTLASTLKGCKFEPESFPGIVYRIEEPKVTMRIFSTGKVVCLGAKSRQDVNTAFEKIYPILTRFRRN